MNKLIPNIYIHILITLSFLNCNPENKNTNITKANNIDEINIKTDEVLETYLKFSDIFSDFQIIPLETKTECLIGNINHIQYYNDNIYILDCLNARALYIFNKDGKFLKRIGTIGKGPGEYSRLLSFEIDKENEKIRVLSDSPRKMITYDMDGKYINEFYLKNMVNDFASINNTFYFSNAGNYSFKHTLFTTTKKGKIKKRFFDYRTHNMGSEIYQMRKNIFKSKNDIKFCLPFCDTIFTINENKVIPYIILNSKNHFSIKDLENLSTAETSMIGAVTHVDKLSFVNNYMENDKLIYLEFRKFGFQHLIYSKSKQKVLNCSEGFYDDITFINPSIEFIDNDKIIGLISLNKLEDFKEIISENKLNLSDEKKESLSSLDLTSNPILIVYELKENF